MTGHVLRRPRVLTSLATSLALIGAGLVTVGTAGSAQAATSIGFVQRSAAFVQPTQVTRARDLSSRLFVVEKAGRIRVFAHGRVQARPYLDIRSRVKDDGEGGLLSVAFHPDFVHHPYFYVAYTNNNGDVRVSRFHAASYRASRAEAGSEKRVLVVGHPHQFTNHYGGQLVFGAGDYLFMSTGDGGGGGDPFNHAQDVNSLQGKILRLQVIGARSTCGRYMCIPKGNPYAGRTPGRGEIWATGLRNAWRFSVDHVTGALWIADVGQDRVEEVDRLASGGRNLGWSCREGDLVYDRSRCRSGVSYLAPTFTYDHSYGNSITGGFVYRGSRYRSLLGGSYIGGDFGSGKVFRSSGGRLVTAGSLSGVTSFGEDDGRELWAVTISGGLYRLTASG